MIEAYQCGIAAWIFLKQNISSFSSYNLNLFIFPTFGSFSLVLRTKTSVRQPERRKSNTFNNQNDILKSDTFLVHFFTVP